MFEHTSRQPQVLMKVQTMEKSHSAAVRPCHTLDKAGKALSLQDSLKAKSHSHRTTVEMTKTAAWSSTLTSNHLVKSTESMLSQIYDRITLYKAHHVSMNCWEVKFVNKRVCELDDEDTNLEEEVQQMGDVETDGQPLSKPFGSVIPKFDRVRRVTLSQHTILKCSCCNFESRGLPCVHIAVVLKKILSD